MGQRHAALAVAGDDVERLVQPAHPARQPAARDGGVVGPVALGLGVAPIDQAAAGEGRIDRQAQQAALAPPVDRGQAGGLEDGGDLGALAAGAHDARARPVPQDETERVEQNRLAGAGLAREHGHPRADLEGHPLDDGQVADLELGQHYSSLAQCSFVRRVAK